MDKHVKAVEAKTPREKYFVYVAWVYAGILSVLVFLQLFAFEDFIPLIRNYFLEYPLFVSTMVACVLAFMEIMALPFLLRMKISPLMRWFSMVCALLVAVTWTKLAVISIIYGYAIENSGLLGSKFVVPAGSTLLLLSLGLFVLASASAYGLWPGVRKRSGKK